MLIHDQLEDECDPKSPVRSVVHNFIHVLHMFFHRFAARVEAWIVGTVEPLGSEEFILFDTPLPLFVASICIFERSRAHSMPLRPLKRFNGPSAAMCLCPRYLALVSKYLLCSAKSVPCCHLSSCDLLAYLFESSFRFLHLFEAINEPLETSHS